MPQEIQKRRDVLDAIKSVGAIADITAEHDGHFEHEIDLEVIVYGRNYNGKKVGPYVRLLVYNDGEEVIHEGEWGGNTFFVVVDGKADVFVTTKGGEVKVAEISAGDILGEMSILAGVPRSATVRAPSSGQVKMLEVQRPALRLLRKLPHFGQSLDRSYRHHGRNQILQAIATASQLPSETVRQLESFSQFRVYGKGHVLFRAGEPISRIYVVKSGWVRLSAQAKTTLLAPLTQGVGNGNGKGTWDSKSPDAYFGPSHAFGLEGAGVDAKWQQSGVLLGRAELLEISVSELRQNPQLLQLVAGALSPLAIPVDRPVDGAPAPVASSQHERIGTGVVDGTNLLVMDMELCVRCGNCSLACHKQHGRSRLVRRGLSIDRPVQLKRNSHTQHLLHPSVCMHCKDPECVTGCPTGAIGRFPDGQVDINPATCIGCGDCATQCPYDAISLVPRRPKPEAAPSAVVSLVSLAQPPLPKSVEETDDLVAVKCNLCSNTPMNPLGIEMKNRAYSCEQNCPTGALLRVDPTQYFPEIKEIKGDFFREMRPPFIRRFRHRNDAGKRLMHILGIVTTLGLTALAIAALWRYGRQAPVVGTWLNFYWMTGILGLVGIVGVMLYPMRRQIYRRRAGALRYWMLSHAYLGVIAGILLLMHGGWRGGGLLTTSLMISFDLVILTGLWGIVVYYVAPRMLTRIEEQPLLVDDLLARRRELAEEIGTSAARLSPPARDLIEKRVLPRFLSLGALFGQFTTKQTVVAMTADARKAFESETSQLAPNDRDEVLLTIDRAATIRRIDALVHLHRLLKSWIAPHVLVTSLMLALMVVHIIQVIYFAAK
jgi:Fe-S-cluster-containing dehydrogenase component/CRP-like cAMP-binding protein